MTTRIGALILAGGKSSRMGFPKPWLSYDERNTYLSRIVQLYLNAGISEIICVINSNFCEDKWRENLQEISKNTKVIENTEPDQGRLYSIQLGLQEVRSGKVFIHNVDSPFIEEELITELSKHSKDGGISIPVYKGRKGHPILISKAVKQEIMDNHHTFETLREAFSQFDHEFINTDDKGILINVNTMEKYEELRGGYNK